MRRILWGLVPVLLLARAFARGGDAQKDRDRLQGAWVVKSLHVGGKAMPPPARDTTLTFEGQKWTQTIGKRMERGTYQLDPSKTPKQMDVIKETGDQGGPVLRGIYSLEGDTRKVGMSKKGPEGPRPASFDDKDASVVTLARVKS
jgi:uncharacterized protein (TIGR03067 family)